MHKIFEIVFIKHFAEVGDNHTSEESEPPNAEILVNTHISFSETDVKICLGTVFILIILVFTIMLQEFKQLRSVVKFVPQSGILLFVGMIMGVVTHFVIQAMENSTAYRPIEIPHHYIQNLVISPIILHASFEIYHPEFFKQIESVMVMAIIGTVFNALLIGFSVKFLYAIHFYEEMTMIHCLVFSIILSAVDPVAVLAVFEAVHADKDLHYLIFGEALWNDGVTFVLFEGLREMAKVRTDTTIHPESYLFVILCMFVAFLGGALIGFLCGAISALITRFTTKNSQCFEPVVILMMAILAYFLAMSIGFSPIISLIVCGMSQMRYAVPNISPGSKLTIMGIVKAISTLCEILIFVLLGTEAVDINIDWIFALMTLFIISVWRFVITFSLVYCINIFRYNPISYKWQLIIFLGGLRGAFAYVMALDYDGPFKLMFHDTTLIIIIVTNIINGIITKPLVMCMKLQQREPAKEITFNNVSSYIAHLTRSGLCNLTKGDTQDTCSMKCLKFEKEYIFRFLCINQSGQSQLVRDFDSYEEQQALYLIETHGLVGLLNIQHDKQTSDAESEKKDILEDVKTD